MELISDDVAINGQNIKRLKRRSFFIMCTILHTQVVKILILYVWTKTGLTFKSKGIRRKRNIQNYYSCRESGFVRQHGQLFCLPHIISLGNCPPCSDCFGGVGQEACILAITGLGTFSKCLMPHSDSFGSPCLFFCF